MLSLVGIQLKERKQIDKIPLKKQENFASKKKLRFSDAGELRTLCTDKLNSIYATGDGYRGEIWPLPWEK